MTVKTLKPSRLHKCDSV